MGSGHRRGNVRSGGRGEKAKSSTQRDHILINWELVQTKLLGANGEASPVSFVKITCRGYFDKVEIHFNSGSSIVFYLN